MRVPSRIRTAKLVFPRSHVRVSTIFKGHHHERVDLWPAHTGFIQRGAGLLLRANARDWERLRYEEGQRVDVNVEGRVRSFVVRAVLHCPGGEPETWAWLKSFLP